MKLGFKWGGLRVAPLAGTLYSGGYPVGELPLGAFPVVPEGYSVRYAANAEAHDFARLTWTVWRWRGVFAVYGYRDDGDNALRVGLQLQTRWAGRPGRYRLLRFYRVPKSVRVRQ